jgi:hypothetical protein
LIVRRFLAVGIGLAVLLAAGCNGSPGATNLSNGASSPPAAAAPTPGISPADNLGGVGAPSIGSILGSNQTPPPNTTWIIATDPGAPFSYEVPSSWTGRAASPWEEGGQVIGSVLAAGPDPTRLATDFSIPGVAIGLSANAGSLSAHEVVEADTSYARSCTTGSTQDTTESGTTASFRLWQHCAGGNGYLLVMAIVPVDGKGLIEVIFQGVTEADLGYLGHIVASLAATGPTGSPGPNSTPGRPVPGQPYTISIDTCQNQHGQGIAEGYIRNDDALHHAFRVVVTFFDSNGVLLNDTGGTTPDVPPGITARWQAVVPSGLPSVTVSCAITKVELVN